MKLQELWSCLGENDDTHSTRFPGWKHWFILGYSEESQTEKTMRSVYVQNNAISVTGIMTVNVPSSLSWALSVCSLIESFFSFWSNPAITISETWLKRLPITLPFFVCIMMKKQNHCRILFQFLTSCLMNKEGQWISLWDMYFFLRTQVLEQVIWNLKLPSAA